MNCLPHCASSFVSLQKEVCNQFTPEIVFHGSQEHGTSSIIEYLTGTSLSSLPPSFPFIFEIYFRPKQLFENERNRVEVIEEDTNQIIFSSFIQNNNENNNNMNEINEIYHSICSSEEVREKNNKSLILRLYLFNQQSNSSFLNIIYFPLEHQSSLSKHISEKRDKSFYCFVLDSNSYFPTASVATGLISQIDKVLISLLLLF